MTGWQRARDTVSTRPQAHGHDRRPVQDQSLEEMQRENEDLDLERLLQARRIQRAHAQDREERDIEELESHLENLESQVDETMSDNPKAFMDGVRQPGGE